MSGNFNISIIGSGNVAWHMAQALEKAGHSVLEVYSRQIEHAYMLQSKLYCAEAQDHLDFSKSKSSIFLLAITDDAIPSVVEELVLPRGAILAHTSGAQPLKVLERANLMAHGVFYPLYSFSKSGRVNFSEIPFFIEADHIKTEEILVRLAQSLSKQVMTINSEQRKLFHLAGVFACNFTNHMLSIAEKILKENHLDFELMKPLILGTLHKSLEIGPFNAQTGPAVRGDLKTLDSHVDKLKEEEELLRIYKIISDHIIQMHQYK
ncbi:Rossmann-like and DUF2520 domain-containing protein [Xanthovirga aplysinae]|uniref:Rossmann-like and DUF2520 domain-containing protein n=1 Tax=Xanthovirga aplysinae TaxID=2529853 RepID=UPI0012BC4304|nr:Rossmann-like and DUF2520 domain-containing protein [Xanthovirga aplysinae]MTI33631.1 DUF2520 domain-containing protein [Xanthovirga aplysinae]